MKGRPPPIQTEPYPTPRPKEELEKAEQTCFKGKPKCGITIPTAKEKRQGNRRAREQACEERRELI